MLQFIRAFTFFFSGSGCVFLSHVWYVSPSPGVCVSTSLILTGRWAHPDPLKPNFLPHQIPAFHFSNHYKVFAFVPEDLIEISLAYLGRNTVSKLHISP